MVAAINFVIDSLDIRCIIQYHSKLASNTNQVSASMPFVAIQEELVTYLINQILASKF